MNAIWILALTLATLLGTAIALRRLNRRRQPAGSGSASSGSNPFASVSILVGVNACPSAQRLIGRRFVAGSAPSLPVDGCHGRGCRCRYLYFSDRRDGDRRGARLQHQTQRAASGQADRREQEDRRIGNSHARAGQETRLYGR